ncbi:centromere protein B dimerization domain [White spot syndrome virus]|uniref:Centromere protein B dimerization domain n=1 Tax=White spot syndrome virus TaxID=342409 RepID=A0A2R2XF17_9VIRU|nr:centromere protein B dimerization domain [White spot syndrome virus]
MGECVYALAGSILLYSFIKNFSKIFSAHSSLEGGPLGRPDVKFGGWIAGSTQCQIARRCQKLYQK